MADRHVNVISSQYLRYIMLTGTILHNAIAPNEPRSLVDDTMCQCLVDLRTSHARESLQAAFSCDAATKRRLGIACSCSCVHFLYVNDDATELLLAQQCQEMRPSQRLLVAQQTHLAVH